MDIDQIKEALEQGKSVTYHVWTFTKSHMCCSEGCCEDSYDDIEDCLFSLETIFCDNIEKVVING